MDGTASALLICCAPDAGSSDAILLENDSEVLLEDGASALLSE